MTTESTGGPRPDETPDSRPPLRDPRLAPPQSADDLEILEAVGRSPQLLADLGHLASAVGHHVINGFAAVVSNAEILRLKSESPSPGDVGVISDVIVNAALDASGVARRLIDFTRPITTPESRPVDLHRLVATFFDAERDRDPNGGRTSWTLSGDPVPTISGSPDQLRVMFSYLMQNCYEAAPGRPLAISAATSVDSRGWVVLEFSDDGPGMTPDVAARAVEPFFSTKPGHVGVGLSIANGIWRRHRGTFSIRSEPGQGTRVRLCVEPARA